MTIGDFAERLARVRRAWHGSVTGGGRTDARSIARRGFAGGPHDWDLAADMIYDKPGGGFLPNRPGSDQHPRFPQSCPECSEEGLKILHEIGHDHLQPADFPAGPVTFYDGETKTWT